MKEQNIIQNYINNFRKLMSRFFKPNIGLSCLVYPCEKGGAILEFAISAGATNEDEYMETSPTVNQALKKIEQRSFGGNLDGFIFEGTNVIMEDNRIILIKGDDTIHCWDEVAAEKDSMRILPSKGRR